MANDFQFTVSGLDPEEFLVTQFHGTEALSTLFRFDIDLVSLDAQADFDAVIGKQAKLTWVTPDGTREIHGLVVRFEQLGTGKKWTNYKVSLAPALWTLGLRRQNRIFQDMSIPDIVEKVLQDAGLSTQQFSIEVSGTHAAHTYCVQYRETDLDFIKRLLEEEGIYFYFAHDDDQDVFKAVDQKSVHQAIDAESRIPFKDVATDISTDRISKFTSVQRLRTGAVMLGDYEFKKPTTDISATATADKETDYEHYEFPGRYDKKQTGDELAKIRLEEFRTQRDTASGKGNCRSFTVGSTFELTEHPRNALNIEHLLVSVKHEGVQPQNLGEGAAPSTEGPLYSNRFTCIPKSIQYRHGRMTRCPIVEGPQTAIVTGPSGEEVWPDPDGHGCVKVQFHWDREGNKDEKSSCWVRVAQGMAGTGWGSLFTPRIGMEVVVEFIDGNPDRPLITGCVYNGANPLPYKLPDEKTRTTIKTASSLGGGGSNEIRFEDKAGSEEVYHHAQKDLNTVVGNDKSETVGNSESISIATDRSDTVGGDEKLSVGGSRTRNVGTNETVTVAAARTHSVGANESINVGAAQEVAVGAAQMLAVGGNQDTTIGSDQAVTIGSSQTINIGDKREVTISSDDSLSVGKKIVIEAGDELTITVGKAKLAMKKDGTVQINGKDITLKGSGGITIKASKDLVLKGKKVMGN